jgi:hypothetical protein
MTHLADSIAARLTSGAGRENGVGDFATYAGLGGGAFVMAVSGGLRLEPQVFDKLPAFITSPLWAGRRLYGQRLLAGQSRVTPSCASDLSSERPTSSA